MRSGNEGRRKLPKKQRAEIEHIPVDWDRVDRPNGHSVYRKQDSKSLGSVRHIFTLFPLEPVKAASV